MLDTFVFSINAVAPLAILMALGVFLNWKKILPQQFFLSANKFSFSILLPVMLFCDIYECSDTVIEFDWKYVGIAVAVIFAAFLLLMIFTPQAVREKIRIGPVVQGIYRSNFLVFGTPVVANMFGEGELWTTSMLLPFIIPIFNILAVIALTWFLNRERGTKRVKETLLGIVKNPLIIAAILSYGFIMTGWKLPTALYQPLKNLKNMGSPLALIALGGTLTFSSMKKNTKALVGVMVGKLIAMPILMLIPAILMGYRGSTIGALLALSGSPAAISSYVMAEQTGNDGDLAGQIIVTTTIASVLTIFTWVFLLRTLGFL